MNKAKKTKKYQVVGLGGTFDHFHQGHVWFLQQAAVLSEMLIVGITVDEMLDRKSNYESLENFKQRSQVVSNFLNLQGIPFEIVPLSDIAGPTMTDERIQAVVLTSDTKTGGDEINRLRFAAGLAKLPIEVVPLRQNDHDVPIASHLIRAGSQNRAGTEYGSLLKKSIIFSESQRRSMREVQGLLVEMINPIDYSRYVVGDSTLRRFLKEDSQYDMAILDGKEQRTTYYPLVIDKSAIDLIVENPAGSITTMLVKGLKLALRQKLVHIFVDGEEDLAACVLQLLLPLGSTIYYGQPDAGLVRWVVTEQTKEKTALLLNPHFQTNPKLVE